MGVAGRVVALDEEPADADHLAVDQIVVHDPRQLGGGERVRQDLGAQRTITIDHHVIDVVMRQQHHRYVKAALLDHVQQRRSDPVAVDEQAGAGLVIEEVGVGEPAGAFGAVQVGHRRCVS